MKNHGQVNISNVPCIDCLTLPMCKSRFGDGSFIMETAVKKVAKHCSILRDYITITYNKNDMSLEIAINDSRITQIYRFFSYERTM